MKKKCVCVLLSAAMAMTMFAGCGNKDQASAGDVGHAEAFGFARREHGVVDGVGSRRALDVVDHRIEFGLHPVEVAEHGRIDHEGRHVVDDAAVALVARLDGLAVREEACKQLAGHGEARALVLGERHQGTLLAFLPHRCGVVGGMTVDVEHHGFVELLAGEIGDAGLAHRHDRRGEVQDERTVRVGAFKHIIKFTVSDFFNHIYSPLLLFAR